MERSMILQEYALGGHEKGQLRREEIEGGAMTSKGFWACDTVESWSAAMQKDPKGWSYTSAGGFVCFRNRVSLCDSNYPPASVSHVPGFTRVSPIPDVSYISEGMGID